MKGVLYGVNYRPLFKITYDNMGLNQIRDFDWLLSAEEISQLYTLTKNYYE